MKFVIYNGDVGYVQEINGQRLVVSFFGKEDAVVLETSDLKDIELAYAITIHKSQGGQYQGVVMPMTKAHSVMLNRNLIYTGITRASREVQIVGSEEALIYGVKRETNSLRMTGLKELLSATDPADEEGLSMPTPR